MISIYIYISVISVAVRFIEEPRGSLDGYIEPARVYIHSTVRARERGEFPVSTVRACALFRPRSVQRI